MKKLDLQKHLKTLRSFVGSLRLRLHALIVLLLVGWAGLAGIAYIFRSVFLPATTPDRYQDWQGYIQADADSLEDIAVNQLHTLRAPIRHYHNVTYVSLYPDSSNGCLTSGCHNPLPHQVQPASRAFANFHTGFMGCESCHIDPGPSGHALWISKTSGDPVDLPPVRQLMCLLEEYPEPNPDNAAILHERVIGLLGQEIVVYLADPYLEHLYLTMNTSEPLSPVWLRALEALREELPHHVRGNYRRKIVWKPGDDGPDHRRRTEQLQQTAREFARAGNNEQARQQILDRAHERLLTVPLECVSCHQQEDPRIDFESLGYSPRQADYLRSLAVARQIQGIRNGQVFHLAPGAEPYYE